MNKLLRLSALLVILNVTHTTLSLEAADVPSVVGPPPIAKKIPKVTEVNGYKLVDNYFWLRDKKNPEVKANLLEVRKQIREQIKAELQLAPAGSARSWEIELGSAARSLREHLQGNRNPPFSSLRHTSR